VGKELVAQRLHAQSERRERPLVQVNCAALPDTLADSELFGHRRGAFTGACRTGPAASSWPTAAPCSWTRWAS
jgi:transcriptional regulator with GAF, ATPase, and Fis domain